MEKNNELSCVFNSLGLQQPTDTHEVSDVNTHTDTHTNTTHIQRSQKNTFLTLNVDHRFSAVMERRWIEQKHTNVSLFSP